YDFPPSECLQSPSLARDPSTTLLRPAAQHPTSHDMTREPARPCLSGHPDADLDLLALLWEEAPFPRLPRDAPPELKELVQNIENPRHVYTVHRAARRHNFQALVEK